jgi:cell division protein FtsI (penicillin-binding protein 3)
MKRHHNNSSKLIPWRYYALIATAGFLMLALLSRAAFIQIFSPEKLRHQQDMRTLRLVSHQSQRGLILDRHNDVLAASVPLKAIWVDPKFIQVDNNFDNQRRWQALADVLSLDKKTLQNDLLIKQKQNRRFIYLKRQITPAVSDYITDLKLSGIHSKDESKRFYPAGESSASILGITNIDDQGIEGLERYFNHILQTQPMQQKVRKSRDGYVVEHISTKPGQDAKNIILSIDQRIQALAYSALKKATAKTQATSGSVVVMNVETGEVLAMANTPSFNPNDGTQKQSFRMRNRAITDTFELGSVIKPFIIVAGLESGSIHLDSVIDTSPGYLYENGRRFARDSRNFGRIDLETILQKSSNVGVTKVALSMNVQDILNLYSKLGLGSTTGIESYGESSGVLRTYGHKYSRQEQSTLSYGYGFTATALQLTQLYATLANDGIMMPATLLKVGDVQPQGQQIIQAKYASAIMQMLEGVANDSGTAKKAKIQGYQVAGKTGTSRKASRGGYGDEYVASFAGAGPLLDPKIAVGVVLNEPKGDHYYGGDIAAPIFSEVMAGSLLLLNIPPDEHNPTTLAQALEQKVNL